MKDKKVVDLIYIEPQKDESSIVKDYQFSIDYWKKLLRTMQETYYERHYDSTAADVLEILNMRKFLGQFLQNRLDWIVKEVDDEQIRRKYLNMLPPFPQKGGIKTLFRHFFQVVESENKKDLTYQPKTESEREISVLWDIYKLRRTIQSIDNIRKSLRAPDPFKSVYDLKRRNHCLISLKSAFQLMFQMCIRKEFQKELYQNLSPSIITPQALLDRKEKGIEYVYRHVLKKYDYRNHFFYIYYFPGMKAKIGGEIKKFAFNYLDFELIKQEFLIDWLNRKLAGNPKKKEAYRLYMLGTKTLEQIVEETPEKELEILHQLPLNVFNDLTAEVNEEVAETEKTAVDPFSENHGEHAIALKNVKEAKRAATFSLKLLKSFVAGKRDNPVNDETVATPKPGLPSKPEPVKSTYEIIKIKQNQIDYPYFQKETTNYKQRLALLKVKMGIELYNEFNNRLSKFFASVADTAIIRRRTPKHEVIFPHYIKENIGDQTIKHILILGAEVKSKQLGMGYGTKSASDTFSFTGFFVYGSEVPSPSYGAAIDTRNAMGATFQIYDFTNDSARNRAFEFYKMVMEQKG